MPQDSKLPFGMIAAGNIDLNNRPAVHNPNGTHSSELSFSRGTDKGEVLVPQVVGGKMLPTQGEAWRHYQDTGENLGTFSDPDIADEYARQVHMRMGQDVSISSKHPEYIYSRYRPQSGRADRLEKNVLTDRLD